jgi:hypothetical protein
MAVPRRPARLYVGWRSVRARPARLASVDCMRPPIRAGRLALRPNPARANLNRPLEHKRKS